MTWGQTNNSLEPWFKSDIGIHEPECQSVHLCFCSKGKFLHTMTWGRTNNSLEPWLKSDIGIHSIEVRFPRFECSSATLQCNAISAFSSRSNQIQLLDKAPKRILLTTSWESLTQPHDAFFKWL